MPSKPDPEKLAQALHLRRTQPELSLKQIAERIGVRSPTTVSNYLAMAEHHEEWVPAVNRAVIGARWDLVASTVMDRLLKRLDTKDVEVEKVATAIARYLDIIAKRHALYAPTKTENTITDAMPAPDPEMTLAIQRALARLEITDGTTTGDDDGRK